MKRYLTGKTIELTCSSLGLNLADILAESKIRLGQSALADFRFSAAEIARIYSTLIAKYEQDDIHIKAAKEHVGNIHGTGELAFLVSSSLGEAMERMAKMKSWIKPVIYDVSDSKDGFEISVRSIDNSFPMSALLEISCFIYTVETFRYHSGEKINARHIQITDTVPHLNKIEKDLGCKIKIGDSCRLVFDSNVRHISLTPSHPFLKSDVDEEISKRQYIDPTSPISTRTKQILNERLMDHVSADSIAHSLGLSKRTFERRLSQEGTSYRQLLEKVRSEKASVYMASSKYSLGEISYLLGFQEPNSFLRAFKRWHGYTPSRNL